MESWGNSAVRGEAEALRDGRAPCDKVAVGVTVAGGVPEGVPVGVPVETGVAEGVPVGVVVPEGEEVTLAVLVGELVGVGELEGG